MSTLQDRERVRQVMKKKAQWLFWYGIDFASVARAGNQGGIAKVDVETHFVCLALALGVYFDSTVNLTTTTGISGIASMSGAMAKLTRKPSPIAGVNTNGHLGQIKLQIQTNDRPWMNQPVRADMITGEPGELWPMPRAVFINAGSQIMATLYNNLPASVGGASNPPVDANLVLIGFKQRV